MTTSGMHFGALNVMNGQKSNAPHFLAIVHLSVGIDPVGLEMTKKQLLLLQKIDTAILKCRQQGISDEMVADYLKSLVESLYYISAVVSDDWVRLAIKNGIIKNGKYAEA